MKKQLPVHNSSHTSNLSWYCLILISFFISCKNPFSLDNQKTTVKKAQIINNNKERKFTTPMVVHLTMGNRPKTIKAGKPVTKIDFSGVGIPFFTNYGTDQGLPQSNIICSAIDKAGNLWFGTGGGGVSKYDGKSFTNYSMSQGLASTVVFYILEDKVGNIWFGTTAGVSKYDGNSFKNYTVSQGMAGNFISCIMQDISSNLWFGTHDGGVSKYDGKKFTNYGKARGLADNYVRSMLQDKKGNIWFGTEAGGVSKYDGNKFTNYSKTEGLANNSVNSIAQDKAGNLWFGTNAGVSKYNWKSFTNYTKADGLADNNVFCILQDKVGNLWFCTHTKGVSKYDGSRFTNYAKMEGLAENKVNSMLQDRAGNLWFATQGGGVSKLEDNSFTNYTTAQGLTGNLVFYITQDKPGNLWFGTYEGGVSKYDGKSFTNYTTAQGLADNIIWCILPDKAGNIWFGTDKGASKFDDKSFTNYKTAPGLESGIISLMQDKAGNMWFGSRGNGVNKYDGKSFTNYTTAQGLAGNNIQSIIQDKAGNIWFATHDDGVSKFDGKSFTNYTTAQGLASNGVMSMIQDKIGNIWFGTNRGASKFDGKCFMNYTIAEGLADNYVWAIAEDKKRNIIWFGTNLGLSGFRQKPSTDSIRPNYKFEIFNKNTGYPIKDVSTGGLFVDNKGIIWVGSGDGKLIRFNYSTVNKKNTKLSNLKIQSLKVNNENICWNNLLGRQKGNQAIDSLTLLNEMVTSFGKVLTPVVLDSIGKKYGDIKLDRVTKFYPVPINLVLPYEDNNVSIDFVAIEPALQKQVKYQYKLEGYDKEWSPISNASTAVFGNISGGNYTFKLKTLSPFGVWSEIEYTFRVLPPWWFTWWAFISYLIVASGIVYTFYRNQLYKIERNQAKQMNIMVATQEEERKRISRDLHDDVGIKLSALKLFLSSLYEKTFGTSNKEIILLAQNSEKLISEVMQDVRQLLLNLSPMVLEEFGYATAVEGLVNKINETEHLRFNLVVFGMKQRLQKDYELALYRITQELINNVLKHAEAKQISLQIGQRDEKIILMIEDDGRGFEVGSHKDGYGLHNLEVRTKLMKGSLTIDSQPEKGTSVLIEIPYNLN